MSKYLNSKQAAALVGVSSCRLMQLIKPDARENRPTGGTKACLYKKETIEQYIKEKAIADAAKIAALIKKELDGVERPGPEWLTPTEASQHAGVPKSVLVFNLPYKCKYVGKTAHRFFHIDDLVRLPANAKARPKGKSGRKSLKTCITCGRTFKGSVKDTECKVCLTGVNDDDPYGVMVRPRKQQRKCPNPGCGADLYEGQFECCECRATHAHLWEDIALEGAVYL